MEVVVAKPPECTISTQNIVIAIKYMEKTRLLAFCSGDCIIAGSLESANSSILAACRLFKEVVGKKSGFYAN